jgi:hypothetical protein
MAAHRGLGIDWGESLRPGAEVIKNGFEIEFCKVVRELTEQA